MQRTNRTKVSQQLWFYRGQAAVEFIIIFPVLFLILWSIIQFSLVYQAKTALHYATFNGARYAAVRSGTSDAVKEGIIKGMIPYYTTEPEPAAVMAAERRVRTDWDDEELYCVNRVNPTEAAFLDFGDPIPNDNLLFRSPDSGSSGLNIQDANLLKIETIHCYPFLDLWNSLEIMEGIFDNRVYVSPHPFCLDKRTTDGRRTIAIKAASVVRMQSPIQNNWAESCD